MAKEYIERSELLRQLRNSKADKPHYGDWDGAHDCCISIAESIPAADVAEVRHGEWIKWGSSYKCSCCDLCNPVDKPYCPNCGADMRGGKNETT